MKVGKNDPCPCGSGMEYGRCCLPRQQEVHGRLGPAMARAESWLESHRAEVLEHNFLDLYVASLEEGGLDALDDLPPELEQMLDENFREWLLAEGLVDWEADEPEGVLELVLETSGLPFDDEERLQLEELGLRALSLYEVEAASPGGDVRVRDLLDPEAPLYRVHGETAPRQLVRWDVLGARLIPIGRDEWVLSGAAYVIPRPRLPALLEQLRGELEGADEHEGRAIRSRVIVAFWLDELTGQGEPPVYVDTASGEPLELVTDHYEVRDWAALEAALAGCRDVEGDREAGWSRFEELGGEGRRFLLTIEPRKGDALALFARTRRLADEGREWFVEVAGPAVRFLCSEVTDPRMSGDWDLGPGDAGEAETDLPPMTGELMEQVYEQLYHDWPDQPLPALGGETPRQAIRTPEGRERVVELLKNYEHGETRRARREGRDEASHRFLWEALGLDREALLG